MAKRKSVVTDIEAVEVAAETKTYKVLVSFRDRDGKIISQGADYQSADADWVAYLAGNKNKTGKPVIK